MEGKSFLTLEHSKEKSLRVLINILKLYNKGGIVEEDQDQKVEEDRIQVVQLEK